jgi:hypothetical protein
MRVFRPTSIIVIFLIGLAWGFGESILYAMGHALAVFDLKPGSFDDHTADLGRLQQLIESWISTHPNLGWILIASACALLLAGHAWPKLVRRWQAPTLEIVYDHADPRFVRRKIDVGPTGIDSGEYHAIAVKNNSSSKTLHDVSVVADGGEFIRCVFWVSRRTQDMTLLEAIDMHPGATAWIELFGFGNGLREIDNFGDVLRRVQRFCIRATARGARESVAEFEYDPRMVPVIKRIR